MSTDLRDRVTRVEEKVDRHDDVLDRVTETLDRLVRFQMRQEGNKAAIQENDSRVDELADELKALRSYVESRWYVLATLLMGAVMVAEAAFTYLL